MGIVASAICCCSSCAVSMASCCCTKSMGASGMGRHASKAAYVMLLGMATLIAWVGQRYFEDAEFTVGELDFKCDPNGTDGNLVCSDDGFVYRVSFMTAIFFILMLLGSIPVPTVSGERRWAPLLGDFFHQTMWGLKLLIFFGLLIITIWLPSAFFDNPDNGWAWACRIVSGVFLLLQVLLLIDLGYQVNEDWVERAYEGGDEPVNKGWLIGLIVISVVLNFMAVGGLVMLFIQYKDCQLGFTFTIIAAIAYVVFTGLTLFREQIIGEPGAVLPASVVAAYSTYLVWSATESIPGDENCRPFDNGSDLVVFAGIALATASLLFFAYSASKRTERLLAGDSGSGSSTVGNSNMGGIYAIGVDDNGKEIFARDKDSSAYNDSSDSSNPNDQLEDKMYIFFFILITGSMYMAMILTNWGVNDTSSAENDAIGQTSVWVKIASQWGTVLLYIWTLVAPKLMPDRDWSS